MPVTHQIIGKAGFVTIHSPPVTVLTPRSALAAEDPLSWRIPDLLQTLAAQGKPHASLN